MFSYASLAYSTQNSKYSKSSEEKMELARLAPLSSVNDHEGSVLCVARLGRHGLCAECLFGTRRFVETALEGGGST